MIKKIRSNFQITGYLKENSSTVFLKLSVRNNCTELEKEEENPNKQIALPAPFYLNKKYPFL